MTNISIETPLISIIIVNYNGLQYTKQCIESFYQFHPKDLHEVIVVDNDSKDDSRLALPKFFPTAKLLPLSENKGFGVANNVGASVAKGEFLFFVNNDTIFIEELTSRLSRCLISNEKIGIVAPKLCNIDQTFQLSFGNYPAMMAELKSKKFANNYALQSMQEPLGMNPIEKDWVSGAAFMIKKELFENLSGFDEQYFMYFEDVDLCKRVKNSHHICTVLPSKRLIHFGGKSYLQKDEKISIEYRRSQLRYYSKHNTIMQRILLKVFLLIKYMPEYFEKSKRAKVLAIWNLCFPKKFE